MGMLVTGPWPMSQNLTPVASESTLCNKAQKSSIELLPLSPTAPCNGSLSGDFNNMSPLTCIPWLRKIKALQKLRRKMGSKKSGGMSPNNMPPLLFHSVHGENVTISHNGSTAKRTNSFCKAIAFSDRPVKVSEKVCIKFLEVSLNWSGVLRLGFTSHDPSSLRNCLPRYVCPDLTSRPGYWAKAFSEFYVKKDAVLFYYTNSAGDVHFGINGEEKGVFFSGVDTRGPLWAILDIYGNTTCVELVDPRAHLNNSKRCIIEPTLSSREETESSLSVITPSMNGLKLTEGNTTLPQFPCELEIEEVPFHRTRGKNIMMTADSLPNVAIRRAGEYCNAYVFTGRPIRPSETLIVQIINQDSTYSSSLAFGVTSCNPQSIKTDTLPDDSHQLLDRPEYWVMRKDLASNCEKFDVLTFSFMNTGEVILRRNGSCPMILMYVDTSVPLWPFFDLYGTTEKIRLVGTVPNNPLKSGQEPSKSLESGNSSTNISTNPQMQCIPSSSKSIAKEVHDPWPSSSNKIDSSLHGFSNLAFIS